jgi:hypothetical protein
LLAEVKPYYEIDDFKGHHCMRFPFGEDKEGCTIPADASAALGVNPNVSEWEMSHGSGGGTFSISWFIRDTDSLWGQAGNMTRYKPAIVSA